jgi:hypothetical protein
MVIENGTGPRADWGEEYESNDQKPGNVHSG